MLKYKEAILYGILIALCFIFLMSKIVPKAIDTVKLNLSIKEKISQLQGLEQEVKQFEEYERLKKETATKLKNIYSPPEPADTIENSFAIMLDDIINMTKYNNIKVFSIQYTYNPQDEEFVTKTGGMYDGCRIDFELISDYKNFQAFLVDLVKYPYYLKINNFKIIPYQKDKKILLIQLQLTLFVERKGNPVGEYLQNQPQGDQNQDQNNNGENQNNNPPMPQPEGAN